MPAYPALKIPAALPPEFWRTGLFSERPWRDAEPCYLITPGTNEVMHPILLVALLAEMRCQLAVQQRMH